MTEKLERGKPLEELVKGSLNHTLTTIEQAFDVQFRAERDEADWSLYIVEAFADYVIVNHKDLALGQFYKVGSEIARLEQSIEHAEELRERQELDLEQAKAGAAEIEEHINKDQSEIAQLDLTLNELVPGLEQAKSRQESSQASLDKAEAALAEWQGRWDEYSASLNSQQQQANVESTRAEQIQSRLDSLLSRSEA